MKNELRGLARELYSMVMSPAFLFGMVTTLLVASLALGLAVASK